MTLRTWLSNACFQFVHRNNLVYNTCWEDPRLDRQALRIGPDDTLVTITSAGCNVLDYALDGPRRIYAVDLNPRQNALLALKIAAIRRLDYERFFLMFGQGRLADCWNEYQAELRPELPPWARAYWDRHIDFFTSGDRARSFYFRGTAGAVARWVNWYVDHVAKARDAVTAILHAPNLEEQQNIYHRRLHGAFWGRLMRWFVGRDSTLSMLGVPPAQRKQVETHYVGGIARFIEDCIEAVFAQLPLADNYFWRVYLNGEYAPDCCPEYLKPANFARLKAGLADCISCHNCSILQFLRSRHVSASCFVLLDHMDWLSAYRPAVLREEWQALLDRAEPGARFIWRSGGLTVDYVDPVAVRFRGHNARVGELLNYDSKLAAELHARDRVHTYGSFYVASLAA